MPRRRRSLLRAGVAAASVAVAGCSFQMGVGTDGGDETVSADGSFDISNVVFCAREPAGYRDYVSQPGAQYGFDERIWVYYEIDGLNAVETADGYRVDYRQTMTLVDPGGETVGDETIDVEETVPSEEALDQLFIKSEATSGIDRTPGTWRIDIEMTDRVADVKTKASATFTLGPQPGTVEGSAPFGVSDLTFCAREPDGYDDYIPQPGATYEPYEDVWLYFAIDGATAVLQDGEHVVDITQQLRMRNPGGETVLEDTHEFDDAVDDIERYHGWNRLRLADDAPPGEFEVSFQMRDNVTSETTAASASFTHRRGTVQTDQPFEVGEFVFCSGPPSGLDEYTPQPDATYSQGDSVWMYADFEGMNYEATSEGQVVGVDGHLTVTNPLGGVDLDETHEYRETFREGGAGDFFVSENAVASEDAKPGDYVVEFRFTDTVTGSEATVAETFTIER